MLCQKTQNKECYWHKQETIHRPFPARKCEIFLFTHHKFFYTKCLSPVTLVLVMHKMHNVSYLSTMCVICVNQLYFSFHCLEDCGVKSELNLSHDPYPVEGAAAAETNLLTVNKGGIYILEQLVFNLIIYWAYHLWMLLCLRVYNH